MKRLVFTLFLILGIAQAASAQTGVRIFGSQQFVLDDNTFANPKIYLSSSNGSMGIDQNGVVSGAFPNSGSLLTLLAGSKTTNLKIDGGSTWGIDIVNTKNGIRSAGRNIFGDGADVDDNIFNLGGGNIIINTLPTPALPGALSNVTYMNANQMAMTPAGLNIISGSGTLNSVPLWTPSGFQLGNSILAQPTTSTMTITPLAGGTNVLTINNGNFVSTALKINANGGTGINIASANTGLSIDAAGNGIVVGTGATKPTNGIILIPATTGVRIDGSPSTTNGVSIDMFINPVTTPGSSLYQGKIYGASGSNVYGGNVNVFSTNAAATGFGTTTSVIGTGNTNAIFGDATSTGSGSVNAIFGHAIGGVGSTGTISGGIFTGVGSALSPQTNGVVVTAVSANASPAVGGVFFAQGSTASNIGIQTGANGAGSTGINISGAATSINADATIQTTGDVKLGAGAAFYAASGSEDLKMLRGTVSGTGLIALGTGFTIVHTVGTNIYTVNFTIPFSSIPSVVVSSFSGAIGAFYDVPVLTTGTVFVFTYDKLGNPAEEPFHFIAMGPR